MYNLRQQAPYQVKDDLNECGWFDICYFNMIRALFVALTIVCFMLEMLYSEHEL